MLLNASPSEGTDLGRILVVFSRLRREAYRERVREQIGLLQDVRAVYQNRARYAGAALEMVPGARIELATQGFSVLRSTD
jgi:hypothetical protein